MQSEQSPKINVMSSQFWLKLVESDLHNSAYLLELILTLNNSGSRGGGWFQEKDCYTHPKLLSPAYSIILYKALKQGLQNMLRMQWYRPFLDHGEFQNFAQWYVMSRRVLLLVILVRRHKTLYFFQYSITGMSQNK